MNHTETNNENIGTGNVLYGKTRALVGGFVISGIVLGGGGIVYSAMELTDDYNYVPDSPLEKGAISLAAGSLLLLAVLKSRWSRVKSN